MIKSGSSVWKAWTLWWNVPDVCVAVSTADCVPVLLYAPDRKVVAAVHAGWRGTVLHIARKAASLMIEAYDCDPTQLVAGIGPSISQAAFEVGEEVVKAFQMAGFPMERILRRNAETQKAHMRIISPLVASVSKAAGSLPGYA